MNEVTAPPGRDAVPSDAKGRFRLLRRVLPLLLIFGAAVWYFRDAPRDVTLSVDLTGRRDGLVALRLEVLELPGGELARHVEMLYSPTLPAPPQQRIPTRLAPGEYQADLVLDYGSRTVRTEQRFDLQRQEEIFLQPQG